MRWLTPHLVCLGCGGEDETHRACLRHEDPQQVGDAEKSRGTQLNLSQNQLVWFRNLHF